jgi:hypothetical protein
MAHRYDSKSPPDSSATEAALDTLDADGLRGVIRDLIPLLDESTSAWLVNALVDRAARNSPGWVPAGPAEALVADIVGFGEAAKRVGYAEPSTVDDYLRVGSNAFLGQNYQAALQIFRALLIPMGDGDFDLGQDEMVDEVLGVDVQACAAQYVVSIYMTATTQNRAKAVLSAIDEMRSTGHFWEPLREMERVAVEPLPELDVFLVQWRALVEERVPKERNSDWDSDEDRWLREVLTRMEGADGLASIARTTKRSEDLRAWCRMHAEARDWKAALAAYDEAAGLVTDKAYARGDFLDGAALSAQELDQKDLPDRLGRAWREAPSMVRLRRWLGSSKSKKALRQRVAEALDTYPRQSDRQRALLHVLNDDFEAAAMLLANAPGLGWSRDDHPGHLLFPLFCTLLGGVELSTEGARDFDAVGLMSTGDGPRLKTPEIGVLLDQAGVTAPTDSKTRAAVLEAMHKAAAKRIEGVTGNKRRRHYGHAASLALAYARVDGSPEAASWLAAIRDEYRRYPALQRELDPHTI